MEAIKVAVITVSDRCSRNEQEDRSGPALCGLLPEGKFELCEYRIVPDETEQIQKELVRLADDVQADVILTTGGTGLGPRDVTPEATAAVCDRMVPGLAEVIRTEGLRKTKNAMLSRGAAGVRNRTLIINLPGSPKGATESLQAVLDVLPHARDMLLGRGH